MSAPPKPPGLSTAPTQAPPSSPEPDDPPPFLGSWRNVYLLLVAELLATAGALYALTRWLS